MFSRMKTLESTRDYSDKINLIAEKIREVDAIIIGAGAGLSTSAGFTYSGERFNKYFSDLEEKYGFHDMYSGSFYDYGSLEDMWAFWSRDIFINRYMDAPKSVYSDIFHLVKNKNYFVLTTNVDHCFQKAGFDKKRLFYTQGDYGLFQCSEPCHDKTYDNEQMVFDMLANQGYEICDGELIVPEGRILRTEIDSTYIPRCPKCGKPMSMNLRSDSTFVQDEGWEEAAERYSDFLEANKNERVLFIELGVGYNTPGIIKYPFWQYTYNWEDASYVCINKGQADVPSEIKLKSICVDADIAETITMLKEVME